MTAAGSLFSSHARDARCPPGVAEGVRATPDEPGCSRSMRTYDRSMASTTGSDPEESLDRLVADLTALRAACGAPSFARLAEAVATVRAGRGLPAGQAYVGRSTVHDAFRSGRRRISADLVGDIVRALTGDADLAGAWSQRAMTAQGRAAMAQVVTATTSLPGIPDPFVGRRHAVEQALAAVTSGDGVVAIEGPAGAGKTTLAAVVGHRLLAQERTGVLVVRLRGFDPDRPPAHPVAAAAAALRALGEPTPDGAEIEPLVDPLHRRLADDRRLLILDDVATSTRSGPCCRRVGVE